MVDKPLPADPAVSLNNGGAEPGAAPGVRRGPGHRGADMRDTVAELAERAQLISQEAGSKVSLAMKDVISAAAGIAGFAIESARDLVQYMVRRGQMTQEEADKLIREAEDAHARRPASEKGRPTATKVAADRAAAAKAEAAARAAAAAAAYQPHALHAPAKAATHPSHGSAAAKQVARKSPEHTGAPARKAVKSSAKPARSGKQPKSANKAAPKAAKRPAKAPAKKKR